MDHPKKTGQASLNVNSSKQEVSPQMEEVQGQATTSVSTNTVQKPGMNMLVTSKEWILSSYGDDLKVSVDFQDLHTTYRSTLM